MKLKSIIYATVLTTALTACKQSVGFYSGSFDDVYEQAASLSNADIMTEGLLVLDFQNDEGSNAIPILIKNNTELEKKLSRIIYLDVEIPTIKSCDKKTVTALGKLTYINGKVWLKKVDLVINDTSPLTENDTVEADNPQPIYCRSLEK